MRRRLGLALLAVGVPATLAAAQKPARKPETGARPAVTTAVTPSQPVAEQATPRARFAATDSLADHAPAAVERSVPALAAYLARAGSDETTKARALYRWIAGHIDYDVAGFRAGRPGDVSPEGVLRSRSSVCEGYARLAEALGTAMGLQVQVVPGWSKGYGFTAGQRFDGPTNHAWNAVRIDGQWRLMDPTWGAGYLDQSTRFVRRFQEHYFLTPPDAFVFDHLPQDPQWQLLERPISAAEYEDLVYLRPMFFLSGFRIGSHPRARIAADDRVTVTLGVTQPVEVAASVVDAGTDRPLQDELTFVQVSGDRSAGGRGLPPRRRLRAARLREAARRRGLAQLVLDYRVQATRGAAAPRSRWPSRASGRAAPRCSSRSDGAAAGQDLPLPSPRARRALDVRGGRRRPVDPPRRRGRGVLRRRARRGGQRRRLREVRADRRVHRSAAATRPLSAVVDDVRPGAVRDQ